MKTIKQFVKEYDIQAHLLEAVDDQSRGDWTAFEGLQTEGVALVRVKWDGVHIHFLPVKVDEGLSHNVEHIMEKAQEAGEKLVELGIFEPGTVEVTVEKVEDEKPSELPRGKKRRDQ